ncbi:MAG: amidohydrolase [Bacteroidetes bacterium]|nr:amidohydrolase [Bacteroidota bacterium]
MIRAYIIYLSLMASLWSCKKDSEDPAVSGSGEQVYYNGQIYTLNPNQVWADAMLVRDGKIVVIGEETEVRSQASAQAQIIDLQSKMVMPGIHDVHLHPMEAASTNFQFSLSANISDPENYKAEVQQALSNHANANWLLGWGFDIYTLLDANRPPIEILDDISTSKPIAIMELSSHSIWVNSKALELAGIDEQSANPVGGVIMKDEDGFPNGILMDNAGNLVVDLAIASIPNAEQNDYDGLVNYALPELAKNGITSICDARTYWKRNHHLTWQRVEDEGLLTARVNLGLWVYPNEDDMTQLSTLQSLYSNEANSFLKINQIKLYADGIIINTTAAMQSNYLIDLFQLPTNNGINYVSENRIIQYIASLEPIGFDFHIHAIGNRGVHEALNAIEQGSNGNGRHRLTHVEYVSPSDIPRFSQLNVTADAQVVGHFAQPGHWHNNDSLVHSNLNNAIIPIKSLQQASARITLSSDWDVSSLNPFIGIQNALTRVPQELTLTQALKAYTLNGAYLMRQEQVVGSLEPGKEADFIVLSQNLFNIPVQQIAQTEVLKTYLSGELIYQR